MRHFCWLLVAIVLVVLIVGQSCVSDPVLDENNSGLVNAFLSDSRRVFCTITQHDYRHYVLDELKEKSPKLNYEAFQQILSRATSSDSG